MVNFLGNVFNWGQGAVDTVYRAVTPQPPTQTQTQSPSNQGTGTDWGSQVMDAVETSAPVAAIRSKFGSSPFFSKTPSKSENDAGVTYSQGTTDKYAEADAAESAKYTTPLSKQESTSEKDSSDDVSGGAAWTNKTVGQPGEVTANWIEPQSSRPGYRKVADLGLDRKTYSLMSEGYTPLQAVTQRLEEETNPRIRRELDWQQGQLLQNKIELSSEYHHWGMDTGRPVSVNPFENQGDMALAIKEGTRQEGKLQIARSNPGVLGIMQVLPEKDYVPGGMGWGDITWENAKPGGYQTKSPSLQKAINEMESKAGNLGVYGGLNPNRDYAAWNKSHPNAPVSVMSPMDILYGPTRTKRVAAKEGVSTKTPRKPTQKYIGWNTGDNPDNYEYDNVGLDLNYLGRKDKSAASVGAFGSGSTTKSQNSAHKNKGNIYTHSHKELDGKMNDILFGNNTSRSKPKKQTVYKPMKESTMLREMGLVQKPVQRSDKKQAKTMKKNQKNMFWGI